MRILRSDVQRSPALLLTRDETFGEPLYNGWCAFSETLISVDGVVAAATSMQI